MPGQPVEVLNLCRGLVSWLRGKVDSAATCYVSITVLSHVISPAQGWAIDEIRNQHQLQIGTSWNHLSYHSDLAACSGSRVDIGYLACNPIGQNFVWICTATEKLAGILSALAHLIIEDGYASQLADNSSTLRVISLLRERDGGQNSDNSDHYHQFDQGETWELFIRPNYCRGIPAS